MQASKVGSLFVTLYFAYSDSTTSAMVLTNFRTQYSGRLVYLLAFVLRIQEVPESNLALKMTILRVYMTLLIVQARGAVF